MRGKMERRTARLNWRALNTNVVVAWGGIEKTLRRLKVDTVEVNGRTTHIHRGIEGRLAGRRISVEGRAPCVRYRGFSGEPDSLHAALDLPLAIREQSPLQPLSDRSAQCTAGAFISLVEKTRMAETPAQVAFGLASLLNPLLNPAADCKVRISQEELGKLCGFSRQIVNGALRRLQLAGVVSLEYGGVRVLDVPALNRFAGVVYQ